jgi:TPR repeat protein
MIRIITTISAISLVSALAVSGLESSSKESTKNEFSPKLVQEAESGDAQAEFQLGICYLLGRGVSQSEEEAIKWLSRAADKKHVRALHVLGGLYLNGKNKNEKEAVINLKKAAELNDSASMPLLADCYFEGTGVSKNPKEGYEWMLKAAQAEIPYAQYRVGIILAYNNDPNFQENGEKIQIEGLQQNKKEAIYWLKKAGSNGWDVKWDLEGVEQDLKSVP